MNDRLPKFGKVKLKLIDQGMMDKIKIIKNLNIAKKADLVKLFMQEISELKGERVPLQINGVENIKKSYIKRDERQAKEMADCIILWLQMNDEEQGKSVEKGNWNIIDEIQVQLTNSDDFLKACINYKIERTIMRMKRDYYE